MDPHVATNMHKLFDSGKFEKQAVLGASQAAYNIADWAYNIIDFNEAFRIVQPLEELKQAAEKEVEEKSIELEVVIERVRVINEKLADLQAKLDDAMTQKNIVEAEKQKYQDKLERAGKLVNGLAGENIRWSASVVELKKEVLSVIGDCLLAAEFVSYIAPFTAEFRYDLWKNQWIPNIKAKNIPITEGTTPMTILTNPSQIAQWKNEGLPEDPMSIENASVITSCTRWPLMIDPQLQGTNWLKGHVAASNSDDEEYEDIVRFS